jgi:hypothetical protein
MILLSVNLGNVETFYNCLKLAFFGLKIRLLLTDLFWVRFRIRFRIRFQIRIRIRIRNVYFGSGSDPAKSFGFLRIRFRIRICNTAAKHYKTPATIKFRIGADPNPGL